MFMAGVSVKNEKDFVFLTTKNASAIVKTPHPSSNRFHGQFPRFLEGPYD
jgi:hypothetical protein